MTLTRVILRQGAGFFLALFIAAAPLPALIIQGLPDAAFNERFSSGFPAAPVANASGTFLGAGLDFSGVGWLTGDAQFGLTLISAQHFLITTHTKPAPGSSVSFLNQAGVVKTYTVDSTYVVTHAPGVNTDITLGRLAAPIAAADLIASYPVLGLDNVADYLNLPLLVYGKNGRVGQNTLDAFYLVDMLPFGGGDGTVDSALFSTDLDPVNGQSQGQVGDSGSPSFHVVGSTLAVLGIHSAIDTLPALDLTYDSFIPFYAEQIDGRLALDGYTLQQIPEPTTTAAMLGLAVLAVSLRRRLKSR